MLDTDQLNPVDRSNCT